MTQRDEWVEHMRSLLGKEVVTKLDWETPVCDGNVQRGTLLSFTEDGEVVIRDEEGVIHWCWPNLETVAA